jgi:hypothetical protein
MDLLGCSVLLRANSCHCRMYNSDISQANVKLISQANVKLISVFFNDHRDAVSKQGLIPLVLLCRRLEQTQHLLDIRDVVCSTKKS